MNQSTNILIIEDDNTYQKLYRKAFEDSGYNVAVASDGQEGIEKIVSIKPDMVLLDLLMPIKNGFDVLREVRAIPEHKETPIIILSNLSQEDDIAECKKYGILDFLVKTDLTMKDVVNKVDSLVNKVS
ncbi:response regulator [Candidatus Uhrbacteria bacterium]|jgi:DNA-binding response OmpR family regulator|nr:response regulator [Candidatus Uhrbacteria bacterium]